MNDEGKTIGIISYCTLIGWVIAIILHSNEAKKTPLGAFHLRQSLGLFLTGLIIMMPSFVLLFIPIVGWLLLSALSVALLVFWVLGLISAINGEEKELPVVGSIYQNIFAGIK